MGREWPKVTQQLNSVNNNTIGLKNILNVPLIAHQPPQFNADMLSTAFPMAGDCQAEA